MRLEDQGLVQGIVNGVVHFSHLAVGVLYRLELLLELQRILHRIGGERNGVFAVVPGLKLPDLFLEVDVPLVLVYLTAAMPTPTDSILIVVLDLIGYLARRCLAKDCITGAGVGSAVLELLETMVPFLLHLGFVLGVELVPTVNGESGLSHALD